MKKIKKSTGVSLALLLYVTVMSIYLAPQNTAMSVTEKVITISVAYIVVFVLWRVLCWKERLRDRREQDFINQSSKNEQKK